jgi:hypothetical protein
MIETLSLQAEAMRADRLTSLDRFSHTSILQNAHGYTAGDPD